MAVKRATCWIGGWDLTGAASSLRIGLRRAELDRTSVSDDHTRTVAGLRQGRLEASGFLDEPADDRLPLDYYNRGDTVLMTVDPAGPGQPGDVARVLAGRILEWRHAGRVGQLRQWDLSAAATEDADLPGADPILQGWILDWRDMVTPADDEPSPYAPLANFPGVPATGTLWGLLHVFALDTRTTIRLKVQTAPTNAPWTDRLTWPVIGPPTADTDAVGTHVRTRSGAIAGDTRIRTIVTIGGTDTPHACIGVSYGVV